VAGDVFDSAEIELMEALVAQAGIALKNARLYEDLQHQMEELSATQQQLVQSAKLAAIGELAAGVAHELNNPLTVIVGNTDYLIRKAPPGSIAVQFGETIKAEALRASRITRALLDFARRREPQREALNVNTLVPRALELMQTKLRGRDIAVETAIDSTLPALLGDSDQLLQVMINLIGNAIDAMPNGGKLVVKTEAQAQMEVVRFSVSDTGTGMTAEQIARIFEPFYTTKPDGKGTGLGLSVTLGIVENHGGAIVADSTPERGTTMTVDLPVSVAPEPVTYGDRVPAGSGSGR
jgi:signal transduction histidine kinase